MLFLDEPTDGLDPVSARAIRHSSCCCSAVATLFPGTAAVCIRGAVAFAVGIWALGRRAESVRR